MPIRKLQFIVIFLFISNFFTVDTLAQKDNLFWFGAPDVTCDHDGNCGDPLGSGNRGGEPIKLRLTTTAHEADVKITQPANPAFSDITLTIPPNSTETVDLTSRIGMIENYITDSETAMPKGIKIEVLNNAKISAYYEVMAESGTNNPEVFALKGRNALGYDFYIPAQDTFQNEPSVDSLSNGYVITATKNGTEVEITNPTGVPTKGHSGGATWTVTLNKGQTYAVVAAGNSPNEHLGGSRVRVLSGGPIAITIYDDSVTPPSDGCYDLMGDQNIPVVGIDESGNPGDTIIGREYILMKGELGAGGNDVEDHVFVFSVKDGTNIKIIENLGASPPDTVVDKNLDAGQSLQDTLRDNYTYVLADEPVYVLHVSGFGCEMGQAVLPTISSCTGSHEVGLMRSSSEDLFLNIMVRKDSDTPNPEDHFSLNGNPVNTDIQDVEFTPIPGTKWLAANIEFPTADIPQGAPYRVINEEALFHLGMINGSTSGGTRYGYFSNYQEIVASADLLDPGASFDVAQICYGEKIQLEAVGGSDYKWMPSDHLSDPYIDDPIFDGPPGTHTYDVEVSGDCNLVDTVKNMKVIVAEEVTADYNIDTVEGCSPLDVEFTDHTIGVNEFFFDFNDTDYFYDDTVNHFTSNDDYFDPFTHTYTNTSDSVQIKTAELMVRNQSDCADTLRREIRVKPYIDADFQPDTIGCNPLPVQFRNLTDGGNMDSVRYTWEFGDGNSSYDTIPSHTFQNMTASDTTYTTQMIAKSKFFCRDTMTRDITVHSYIEAQFTLDTIEGCSPLTIDPEGQYYPGVSTYTWRFEGLDTLSGIGHDPSPKKYINRSGTSDTLQIELVVDNGACQRSMTRQVIIHPEVHAEFAPMDTTNCNPVTVSYRNHSTYRGTSDKAGLSYYWDFDDGNTSTAEDPVHKFTNPSFNDTTYNVNLEVVSPRGCRHDTTGSVEVYSYLKAAFSASNVKGCSPLTVSVTNNSAGDIDYYWFWDEENLDTTNATHIDSTISDASFTKTYVNNNSDTVQRKQLTLIVANSQGCTDTMQREITIYPEVTASFTPNSASGCNPYNVSFTNNSVYTGTSSNTNLSYSWDFDDGGSSSEFEPDHTFTNSLPADITYDVELAVESNNGCVDTTDGNVTVHDYINAQFSVDDPVGCAPYTITINEYSKGGITGYEWDWGNGSDSTYTTATPQFSYTYQNTSDTIATFPLTLIVSNNDNCYDTLTRDIKVYPDVEPDFDMSTTEDCHPVQVDFTNNSTPAGDLNYTWDFGDGGTSNQETPSHTFYNFSNTDSTSFKVELLAESDYYCTDSVSKRVYVHHNPKAKIDINTTESCPPLEITADNQSTGGDTYIWNYGDGTSDTYPSKTSVNKSYNNTDSTVANFDLQLKAETNFGCTDSTQLRLSVYPRVEADFTYDSAGCHPFHVQFDNESENADYYYWDFKDGVTSNLEDPVNRFENNTQSNKPYDVFLRASSEFNCIDSATKTVTVYPSPNTAFAVTPTLQVFPNSTVKLDNNTNHTDAGLWDYTWHFGDGETSTATQPGEYTYDDYGEYSIMLEAESSHCYDSVSHNVIIIAPEPIADFTTDPVEGCQPLTVQFSDNSTYAGSYFWDFDDGDTSQVQSPEHTFTEAGTFYVKQTVSGEGGEDYAYKTIKVFKKPIAKFEVEPKFVMLPDEKVAFYNFSKFEDMWTWDFGDGRTANKENPKHLYRDTGRYDIRLEVESYEGCRDTLVKEDIVQVGGKGSIQFPNAFTPSKSGSTGGRWKEGQNLDELNDIFHPIGEGVTKYKLEIFNKWGEKIFESNDFHVGWDGYYQGELMPQDVYIWKAEGKFANGKTFEKMGDVTLIR